MRSKKLNTNKGAAILFIIFGLLFFILIVRFLTIQITGQVDGKVLAAKAAQKYMRTNVIEASRGNIYDSQGEVIAENVVSYKLVAILSPKATIDPSHPKHVTHPRKAAEELAKYIDMPESQIYDLLTRKGKYQVEFGKAGQDISYDLKNKIEKLKLPGITFEASSKRAYPNGSFASHLVGYAQKNGDNGQLQGKMGIEQSLNRVLQGKDGKIRYEGDFWGYILPNSSNQVTKPKNGENVYLTIDKKIQSFLEDAMSKVQKEYNPKKMIVVVADPKTGKILGMGQRPDFDPETKTGLNNSWHNEAVETAYEPGSTMKIFTLAAAVQEGVFNPNATYKSGEFHVKNVPNPIKDHNGGVGWGRITFLEGLQRSSNVAFATLLDSIKQDKFKQYLKAFGFGQQTKIGLPNEASGKILYQYPVERYTTTFGQGTTVTALQMVQAATAVANDGKMMKPYVVDKIVHPATGKVIKAKPVVAGNPITAATAKKVRDYLRTVVTNKKTGTGTAYNIPGYSVTGKTGTAQIPNPNGSGYLYGTDNYIFSFLGMAPKNDPKLIVYAVVQQPHLKAGKLGSEPVKELFNPVMKNSLQYLNIKPGKMETVKAATLPDLTGTGVSEAAEKVKELQLTPVVLGDGDTVQTQLPAKEKKMLQNEKVLLKTNGSETVPDFKGWAKRDVMNAAKLLGLKLNMNGEGYAVSQSITARSKVKPDQTLTVQFKKP
ncbi:penicillin-binding protein [Heyndrickxia acidiproducens]|uniref:penicillin-binding protein n=1 Tax=Heyndrickxia acidiproducens TaxID=1121084 RepID=UPI00037ADC36|nr:penicillin-binding protein [Heyndrickxia acidiproducens]